MRQHPGGSALLERARNAIVLRDFDTAAELATRKLREEPESRDARIVLGTAYFRSNRAADALAAFLSVLSRNADDVEALAGAAAAYLKAGKAQDALTALGRAMKLDPNNAELRFEAGNAHRQAGDLDSAALMYESAIEADRELAIAYNNLGTVHLAKDDPEAAVRVLWRGLSIDHNYPSFHYNLGIAYESLGKLSDAVAEYEQAVKARPGWVDAMLRLGSALLASGRAKDAGEEYARVLEVYPGSAAALDGLGLAAAALGRPDEAIDRFRAALETDPGYLQAAVHIQETLEANGRSAEALERMLDLVRLMPKNGTLRLQLARLQRTLGHRDEALDSVGKVLAAEGDRLDALKLKGALLQETGDPEGARRAWERIVELDPSQSDFRIELAAIHSAAGRHAEAVEELALGAGDLSPAETDALRSLDLALLEWFAESLPPRLRSTGGADGVEGAGDVLVSEGEPEH